MNVRRAIPGDETIVRQLRLAAMTDSPEAFGSNHARELARTPEDWSRWITDSPTFLLESGAGAPIGLVAAVPDRDDRDVVDLMALWVDPHARGVGGGDTLVAAVVAFAAGYSARLVRLHVEKQNAHARQLYERNGFQPTGIEIAGVRPDFIEVEMVRPV